VRLGEGDEDVKRRRGEGKKVLQIVLVSHGRDYIGYRYIMSRAKEEPRQARMKLARLLRGNSRLPRRLRGYGARAGPGAYCSYSSTTLAGRTRAWSGSCPNSRKARRWRRRSQHWSSSTWIALRR